MPAVPVDRDVVHPTHQRTADAVREDLLLGHEPHQAPGRQRAEAAEDEVEVADVVAGQHRAPVTGNVLGAVDTYPQIEYAEQRLSQSDNRRVHKVRHGAHSSSGEGDPS